MHVIAVCQPSGAGGGGGLHHGKLKNDPYVPDFDKRLMGRPDR